MSEASSKVDTFALLGGNIYTLYVSVAAGDGLDEKRMATVRYLCTLGGITMNSTC